MSYGAKLLIVNLNISLYQPWKVHGLHEFISGKVQFFCQISIFGQKRGQNDPKIMFLEFWQNYFQLMYTFFCLKCWSIMRAQNWQKNFFGKNTVFCKISIFGQKGVKMTLKWCLMFSKMNVFQDNLNLLDQISMKPWGNVLGMKRMKND